MTMMHRANKYAVVAIMNSLVIKVNSKGSEQELISSLTEKSLDCFPSHRNSVFGFGTTLTIRSLLGWS
jgi:hypothetical protein